MIFEVRRIYAQWRFAQALHRRSRRLRGIPQTTLVASAAGRLQAFVALGKAAHFAVCHVSLDVLGARLFLSALESSRGSRGRYHEVRSGLRHLRAEGLVRESISCISLAGGDGQTDSH